MSKLLSRHDRWELWMSATPGSQTAEYASPSQPAPHPTHPSPSNPGPSGHSDLVSEVERLRGVVRTAVAALAHMGAHDEASRVRAALETR
jgi:hypothetical protein